MSAATAAVAELSAAPIAEDRAHSLFRWNAVLAALHAIQGVVILALSFAKDPIVSSPVVTSYLTFDTATETLVSDTERRSSSCPSGRRWRPSSS